MINPRPDLPRSICALIAGGVSVNAASGAPSVLEIVHKVQTWQFPQPFPAFSFFAVLVGGQTGRVYTTRYRVLTPDGDLIKETVGPDIPFTTQITRANIWVNLQQLGDAESVSVPGIYHFVLLVSEHRVAEATLEIERIAQPPTFTTAPGANS